MTKPNSRTRACKKRLANHQCERCGSRSMLELHHRVPASEKGGTNIDNLELLCHVCHRMEHGMELDYTRISHRVV